MMGAASTTTRSEAEADEGVSMDTAFFLLQNSRRRNAIVALRSMGGEADFKEVVRAVAELEYDADASDLEYGQRKSVHTSLYQVHLPKLSEAGVIEYDKRGGHVRLTDRADDVEEYLAVDDEDETTVDLSTECMALATGGAVGLVAAVGSVGGVWPTGAIPLAVVLLVVSGISLAVAYLVR